MKFILKNIDRISAIAASLAVALLLMGLTVSITEAAQSPAGCTADNSVVNISSNTATAEPGDTITFTVTAGNPASVDGCDIENRTITLTLPDGTQFFYGPTNYPNPTATGFVGSEDYVADLGDLVGDFWEATVEWNGTLKSVSDIPSNGDKGISVLFDVDPLMIEKTVDTTYDREWTWGIEKSADQTELMLSEGQSFTVNYGVEVSATSEDTNHMVSGVITVTNPNSGTSAIIEDVTDVLNDSGSLVVDCSGDVNFSGFPHTLDGGDTLTCTYSGEGGTGDDENTATVVVTDESPVPGDSVTEDVEFGDPDTETDECITVNDTNPAGPQGVVVCADDAPETFEYSVTFGPEGEEDTDVVIVCGDNTHPNTADFITNDTQTTGDDTWSVDITVECVIGCTLTQGYWKTHNDSFKGGAPTDDGWLNLGGLAEETQFFSSGMTWFDVFWTPPKGNAWYNLAHQYMAAELNILNGAGAPAGVVDAIADAEALFTNPAYDTPAEFAALGKKAQIRKDAIKWAGILGDFNEGQTGPGHCDEDETSDD